VHLIPNFHENPQPYIAFIRLQAVYCVATSNTLKFQVQYRICRASHNATLRSAVQTTLMSVIEKYAHRLFLMHHCQHSATWCKSGGRLFQAAGPD